MAGGRDGAALDGRAQLVRLRRALNCSQELLAERSGISPRAIRDIESGVVARPRRATLACLARGLGLAPPDVDAFVARWYPARRLASRGDRDLLRRGDPIDDYLSEAQRLARARRRTVDWSSHFVVDASRWPKQFSADIGVRATETGLDRAIYLYHHDDDSVDWDDVVLADARNCELERVVVVPHLSVKIFELALGTALDRGQDYRYGVTLDLSAIRTDPSRPALPRTGVGVLDAGMSVTLQVSFTDPAFPERVRYVWSDRALGAERAAETLRLSRFGSASYSVADAETGIHELVWEWPD